MTALKNTSGKGCVALVCAEPGGVPLGAPAPPKTAAGKQVIWPLPADLLAFLDNLGIAEGDDRLGADGEPRF